MSIDNMRLYHATAAENLTSIMTDGLRECCYLTSSSELALYYASTIEDEGRTSAVVEVELEDLLQNVDNRMLYPGRRVHLRADHVSPRQE